MFCELPNTCAICGLTLVSASHLARSYHHLFPVEEFNELPEEEKDAMKCYACLNDIDLEASIALTCAGCQQTFCVACDDFIHNMLYNCPGCGAK